MISERLPGRTVETYESLRYDSRYFGPDFNMLNFKYEYKVKVKVK